jgi:hypothetical protein
LDLTSLIFVLPKEAYCEFSPFNDRRHWQHTAD